MGYHLQPGFLPTVASGKIIQSDGDGINLLNLFRQSGMQIISIGFKNQGSNSIATIKFDGGEITIGPGTNGDGAAWVNNQPSGFIDISNYSVVFRVGNGIGERVDKVSMSYVHIVKVPV